MVLSGKRVLVLYGVLIFCFVGVICRLYWMAEEPTYSDRAEKQSTVTLALPARRGNFYDCDGWLLTGLEEKWLALCFPGEGNYAKLYSYTDESRQTLLYRSRNRAAPFLLEVNADLSGLGVRCYPTAQRYCTVPLCQHLIGYLDAEGRGAAGLEKALDALLVGTGAQSTVSCAVTAQGRLRAGKMPQLTYSDSGAVGVQLTISRPIQRAAEAVAAQSMTTGCILVLDVRTAEVRASVSVPGYDPQELAASLEAENAPFVNRALQSYAVGSVFKPLLAAAALEAGISLEYECGGICFVDGQAFRCAGGAVHGTVDLATALEKSCNGYFIQLGQQLGAEVLLETAQKMGFGRKLWLAGELFASAGCLPEERELAQSGQLANFSFGQGELLASPVQIAGMMNVIASGGVYQTPSFIKGTLDETSGEELEAVLRSQPERVISAQSAETLRQMLVQVVELGTAKDAAGVEGGAGGKTGTAQTGQFDAQGTEKKNLWFAGFYPAQKPRYTIVVLQDGACGAQSSSAAIFAQLCEMLSLIE